MWKEGSIGIPIEGQKGKLKAVHYTAKVYDEPSNFGIDGGRISKLMLKQDCEIVLNYDRGWNIKPTTPEAEIALAILLKEYE